jgi:L-asparaginase / beta-aspartyl-peptidase
MHPFSIAIHGGAGTLLRGQMTSEKETAYKSVLQEALDAGYNLLENKGNSLDAVSAAVTILETRQCIYGNRKS